MSSRRGVRRITRGQFYALGGFSNSKLFRKSNGRSWTYWMIVDYDE